MFYDFTRISARHGWEKDIYLIYYRKHGAFLASDYLIRRMKEQPGYLRSSYAINNFDERADGFYKAIRHHGYSASKSIVHRLSPSIDGAYADMMEILNRSEAIAPCYFADNDMIALGAMKAFMDKGFSVLGISPLLDLIISHCATMSVRDSRPSTHPRNIWGKWP